MTEKKPSEEPVLPSKLSAGAVYRVRLETGNISTEFTSMLTGVEQKMEWLELSFENGVVLYGPGAELGVHAKFHRRVW